MDKKEGLGTPTRSDEALGKTLNSGKHLGAPWFPPVSDDPQERKSRDFDPTRDEWGWQLEED